jgi:hypothetical protein
MTGASPLRSGFATSRIDVSEWASLRPDGVCAETGLTAPEHCAGADTFAFLGLLVRIGEHGLRGSARSRMTDHTHRSSVEGRQG